ncbi:uncharacterized protein LOC110460463 isoform X2 [Mizuhopecten yessoensis]|uniref:uncharacterized protein LOC110460463 isoform X1 n=1 Tax=Mizuhopecten yessoensis TaxID=6573 RepID=UPI000B458E8C|nr:uncharacterized protein LOC110460463 isoform X1 [Mizuhopecten yessoensis]XP_021369069.1 uncharacterized protein LOC110460463 isoform X2 [Mizuhopecten yessoensis]
MPKKKKKSRLTTRKNKSTAKQSFIRRMEYAAKKAQTNPCDAHPHSRLVTPTPVYLEEVCPQQDPTSTMYVTCHMDTPMFHPATLDVACDECIDTKPFSIAPNTHQDFAYNVSVKMEPTTPPPNTHQDVACNVSMDTESTSKPPNTNQDFAYNVSIKMEPTTPPPNTHQDVACNVSMGTETTTPPHNTHQDFACNVPIKMEPTTPPPNTHQDVACNVSMGTEPTTPPHNTHQDVACNVPIKMEPTTPPHNTHQDVSCNVPVKMEPPSLTPNTDVNVNSIPLSETGIHLLDRYTSLRNNLSTGIDPPFLLDPHHKNIHLLQLYRSGNRSVVKTCVTIKEDFTATVNVHGSDISREHELWSGLPAIYDSVSAVHGLLRCLCKYSVCIGNPDVELQDLIPVGSVLTDSNSLSIWAYREGDFCASRGDVSYNSTVRSVKCCLLVEGASCASCASCASFRKALQDREYNHGLFVSKSAKSDSLHRRTPLVTVSYGMLQQKLKQQKDKIRSLESELDALRRSIT